MDETKLIEQATAYGSLVLYWGFALATAAFFYQGTRWVGTHLKPVFTSKLGYQLKDLEVRKFQAPQRITSPISLMWMD